MSPFPQSVSNTSAISTVFFVPSPVFFVLRVPKNLKRPRWIRWPYSWWPYSALLLKTGVRLLSGVNSRVDFKASMSIESSCACSNFLLECILFHIVGK